MTDDLIAEMVNRFLSWQLPKDFCPDAGISFKPTKPYEGDEYGNSWWPVGTNLLTADQAREMITHMLADVLPLTSFATEAEANAYMRGYCEHKRETERLRNVIDTAAHDIQCGNIIGLARRLRESIVPNAEITGRTTGPND